VAHEDAVSYCSSTKKLDSVGCKEGSLGHNPPLKREDRLFMTEGGVLQGRDLAVWRGDRCLFERLSFDLCSGQLGLLVGPNGSGKTTLLRVLAGLAPPTAGVAEWNGTAIGELAPEQRGDLAYRGHLEALKRDLTVRENLKFYTSLFRVPEPLEPVLAELQLQAAGDTRVRYLSAGQKRRAALASLKLSGASLWLLDEPTTNLDRDGRTLLRDWTRRHIAAGGLAVIATHQPDELADRGALVIEL
jgi:heme exporter protein A